jgi:hypothetical protein
MTLRLMLMIVVLTLSAGTAAQSRSNVEKFGSLPVLEVISAELPEVLQVVRTRIASLGFADKWAMPSEVLNQDVPLSVVRRLSHAPTRSAL